MPLSVPEWDIVKRPPPAFTAIARLRGAETSVPFYFSLLACISTRRLFYFRLPGARSGCPVWSLALACGHWEILPCAAVPDDDGTLHIDRRWSR